MANIAKRMKKLKAKVSMNTEKMSNPDPNSRQLLDIRIGPGAAILSNDVKRIHLDFALKINGGHFGARKVWRNYLPRLKYHNPAISMSINRTLDQDGPATLTVFFAAPTPESASATASPAPTPSTHPSTSRSGHDPTDRIETIEMKNKHESEILAQLLELTRATPYEVTPEEQDELREVEDDKRFSERSRQAQAKLNEVKRQEKALLDQARGVGGDAP